MKYVVTTLSVIVIVILLAGAAWWWSGESKPSTKIVWANDNQIQFNPAQLMTPTVLDKVVAPDSVSVNAHLTNTMIVTLVPTAIVPLLPSTQILPPNINTNEEAELLAYSQLLQRHFKQGLAQAELNVLIKQSQARGGQFLLQPVFQRSFLKQNYITLSDKGSGQSFSEFEQQKQKFLAQLQQCLSCNQVFVADLKVLMNVMQSTSPADAAKRIIAKDKRIEARNAMFFAWVYGHYLPLYVPDDVRIAWASTQLRLSDNQYFQKMAVQLLALLENDLTRWLEIWLENSEDSQLIEEWSLKLLQKSGYHAVWKFQNAHWQKLYQLNPEFSVSAIMFHAQYYNVSEALAALESLILIDNDIANNPVYHSLLRAQQHNKQPLSRYWQHINQQQMQHNISQTWTDQRSNEVSLNDWQQRFSAIMSSPQTYKKDNTIVSSWQKQFLSPADGLNILEHQLTLPAVLKHRTILMDAGAYITELESAWNNNVASLNQTQALHSVSTLSLSHWRYIARWSREKSASQLDDMVLFLYDYLLPIEQEKLKTIYQKKVKNGSINEYSAGLSKWKTLQ
jgi:hypothetical protein